MMTAEEREWMEADSTHSWTDEERRIIHSYNSMKNNLTLEQTQRLLDIAIETPSVSLNRFIAEFGYDECTSARRLQQMREFVNANWRL